MRSLATALLLLALPGAAGAAAKPDPPEVRVYTQWDQQGLYFSARIDDPMVTGVHTALQEHAEPWQDDAIEFCLDLGAQPSSRPSVDTWRLTIGAAGGFSVQRGSHAGEWREDLSWAPLGLRFAVSVRGTINRPHDRDEGFDVEVALPWRLLGGQPTAGRIYGFNVVCYVRGENSAVVDWAGKAASPEATPVPANWGRMVIDPRHGGRAAEGDAVTCPRINLPPTIDGTLQAREWLLASTLSFDKPQPEVGPQAPTAVARMTNLVMATYRYDYGPDAPMRLIDQPADGIGPWFSGQRIDWHRQQVRDLQRAGIEVILPIYRSDPESRATWSREGLCCLVQALKDMRGAGYGHPFVGMLFDTAALPQSIDLTSEDGQRLAYETIREFFQHIPAYFRADVGSNEKTRGMATHLVVIGRPPSGARWDAEWMKYCADQFARDFAGARLAWLGDPAWREHGVELDGYCWLESDEPKSFDFGDTRVTTLSPGSVWPGGERMRRAGDTYRLDWMRAMANPPHQILVVSWNDFARADEIAPSRQYGALYLTQTMSHIAELHARQRGKLALRGIALPEVLLPGASYDIPCLIANLGTDPLLSRDGVELQYRLENLKDSKLKAEGDAVAGLALPGSFTSYLRLRIGTSDAAGKPLPRGDYRLTLDLGRRRVPLFSSRWLRESLAKLELSVRIEAPPQYRLTVLHSSLPTHLEAGRAYSIPVTVRNDGAKSWRRQEVRVGCRWYAADAEATWGEPTAVAQRSSRLPRDVAPGQSVNLDVRVEAPQATPGLYRLVWDAVRGDDQWFTRTDSGANGETVHVVAYDPGLTIVDSLVPSEMTAGEKSEIRFVIMNSGSTAWPAETAALVGRWFYPDGAPVSTFEIPLPRAVGPDQSAELRAEVTAPVRPGAYRLMLDLHHPDHGYASAAPSVRGDETRVAAVLVTGSRFQPVALDELRNVVAITSQARRDYGGFDRRGGSYPAELLPPDAISPASAMVPCGYFLEETDQHPDRTPFLMPARAEGTSGAVACDGQTVALPQVKAERLHLLMAASAAGARGDFTVTYADGQTREAPLGVTMWTREPEHGEHVCLRARYLHLPLGRTEDVPCRMFHYIIDLRPEAEVVTLQLPAEKEIKVFAATIEASEG